MENNNNFKTILEAGKALGEAQLIEGVHVVVAPEGYDVTPLDLEKFHDEPHRCKGTVTLDTVDSLCAFIDRNKIQDQTVVFDFGILAKIGIGQPACSQ